LRGVVQAPSKAAVDFEVDFSGTAPSTILLIRRLSEAIMILPLSNKPLPIEYPSHDTHHIAENTLQFRWIVMIEGGIEALFRDDPNVFVAGDLLWYPVEGKPSIRMAPDVLVAFERPKGHRMSYLQWDEGGVPPQVVFEILSPSTPTNKNRWEVFEKLAFYAEHGVEEYYLYDPDDIWMAGWKREGSGLRNIEDIEAGWTSPRLGVHLELKDELILTGPDGKQFLSYVDLARQRDEFQQAALKSEEAMQRMRNLLLSKGIDPDSAG